MAIIHSLPDAVQRWLSDKGFQIMQLRATRPWPNAGDSWIEVSVNGSADSPVTFIRATSNVAAHTVGGGKRGRTTTYLGTGIEVKRDADPELLDAAYQHFLALNQTATNILSGIHKYPLEVSLAQDTARTIPAVKDKPRG